MKSFADVNSTPVEKRLGYKQRFGEDVFCRSCAPLALQTSDNNPIYSHPTVPAGEKYTCGDCGREFISTESPQSKSINT